MSIRRAHDACPFRSLDNRIGMDENGTQTWTLYDSGDPIMDFNSSGSLTMRYLWGPTGIVARQTSGGTVSWYLADALGTVRDLINNSGAIIDHVDFSAFGTVLDESSPTSGDRMMGFAMLERDTVTGLNLAVYREENPATGRWDTQDPLRFFAYDTNLYRYASNESTDLADKDGEFIWIPIIVIAVLLLNATELETPGADNIAVLGMLETTVAIVTTFRPSPGCFVAGTPVATEVGLRPIDQIQEGEKVWSYDLGSAQWFLRRVLSTMRRQYEGDIVTIAVGQDQIRATGNHPFWVTEGVDLQGRPHPEHAEPEEPGNALGRWVDARDLKTGDAVMLRNGERAAVRSLRTELTSTHVFNINVEELNNCCVGAHEILVHNRKIKPGAGGGQKPLKGKAGGGRPGHQPSPDHSPKSQGQKRDRFVKKAQKARDAKQEAYEEACRVWRDEMSPDARKLRPELNPENLK
jgi:RHS repeat-associated protein